LKRVFVDTNIFICYLVNDIPAQIDKAENLFDLVTRSISGILMFKCTLLIGMSPGPNK
jgi:predicted nucleic acid-binding protein